MKLLIGKIIIHESAMDVCYRVLSQYEGSEVYKLKVYVINMGFVNSFSIFNKPSWIEIKKTDIPRWKQIINNKDCYRCCERAEL